jgi:hypothetical protein
MWNNFQSFICEKERIWGNGTKTAHNHPMQHTHKHNLPQTKMPVWVDICMSSFHTVELNTTMQASQYSPYAIPERAIILNSDPPPDWHFGLWKVLVI